MSNTKKTVQKEATPEVQPDKIEAEVTTAATEHQAEVQPEVAASVTTDVASESNTKSNTENSTENNAESNTESSTTTNTEGEGAAATTADTAVDATVAAPADTTAAVAVAPKKKLLNVNLSPLAKRIINIVVDVVAAIILIFALVVGISTIRSKLKGIDDYTDFFGSAYVAVRTDSMSAVYDPALPKDEWKVLADNFSHGDLIKLDLLSDSEIDKLQEGDIISYYDPIIVDGKLVLNTHRIQTIERDASGKITKLITHGDANEPDVTESVISSSEGRTKIVGKYVGKAGGIGNLMLFMSSYGGFFVCIILPAGLVIGYLVVYLVFLIRKYKGERKVEKAAEEDEKRAKMRAELLAEIGVEDPALTQPSAEQAQSTQPAEPENKE